MAASTETVFITKYALTDGVQEAPLIKRYSDGRSVFVEWNKYSWDTGRMLFFAPDFHGTREAAVARAEEMRKAKIASHEKSIAKLQKLTFA